MPTDPSSEQERFYELRKESKIYVSKLFKYSEQDLPVRKLTIVFENAEDVEFGEFEGAHQIRITPKQKNQITAVVFQDTKKIRRLCFTSFRKRKGTWLPTQENGFSFRGNEFQELLEFLRAIDFIDLSDHNTFQIEDHSTQAGKKVIIDRSDANLLQQIKQLPLEARQQFIINLSGQLNEDEIGILLGRKRALQEFRASGVQLNPYPAAQK
jgi:hypothetical protein